MKVSVIFVVLILLNTSALIAEPLAQIMKGLSTWMLLVVEGILLFGYYINGIIRDIRKVSEIDFDNLNLFVIKAK